MFLTFLDQDSYDSGHCKTNEHFSVLIDGLWNHLQAASQQARRIKSKMSAVLRRASRHLDKTCPLINSEVLSDSRATFMLRCRHRMSPL